MDNEKRYIVEQIAAKLMKSCTIHDSGLFICTLNKELDKYHQSELLKLNKSNIISSVCKHCGCKKDKHTVLRMCLDRLKHFEAK